MVPNVFEIVADFCDLLDHAGIRYVVGGSVASGVWGEPRYTNDADIEVWLTKENSARFKEALGQTYCVSDDDLIEALESTEEFPSVQALNEVEVFKFDCFIGNRTPIDEEAFGRSKRVEIVPGREVRLACAEHIIVQKLRWFNAGNRVSDRQWRDMIGVASVALTLDWALISRWASRFGLDSLALELRQSAEESRS